MPTPKVGLFGTSLKMGSKIRKINDFQTAAEIALIKGFWWNLVQMKGLGLIFQDFLKFLIFINFSMFGTYLNMTKIRIFGKYQKHRKSMVRGQVFEKFGKFVLKFFLQTFFSDPFPAICSCQIVNNYPRSKVMTENVNRNFRFSGFSGFPYINSLRKRGWKS